MSKIRDLTEKRAKRITEATELRASITDTMTEAERDEVNTKFDAAMKEADDLAAEIDREKKLDEAQRSLGNSREERRAGREDMNDGEGRPSGEAQYRAAFKAYLRSGLQELEPEQRALLKRGYVPDPETRAQGTTPGAAGGYTVPREFQDELIKTMKAYGPMMDGEIVREITTDGGGALDWPTVNDTANTGVAIAENAEAAGEGDVAFGTKALGAYKFGSGVIKISNELIEDSGLAVEAVIADLMGERIGRIGNAKLTVGAGGTEPQGIVTGSGLGKTAASATLLQADELIDFYHSINRAYRRSPRFRFMFADTTLSTLRKLKDAENRYLIDNLRDDKAVISLGGISVPYEVNDDVPAIAAGNKVIVGGDFSKYVLRKVRGFAVRRLVERFAEYDQVGFVGFTRLDGGVMDTAAIKHLKMA